MEQHWPWMMAATGLWTGSVVLLSVASVDHEVVLAVWGLWVGMVGALVTVSIVAQRIAAGHAHRVEDVAAVAAREALQLSNVEQLHP